MTIELALCIALGLAALPVARQYFVHYAMFAGFNLLLLGYTSADSSLLAMMFCVVAVGDMLIAQWYRSFPLALCSAVSAALCIEQIANGDYLLQQSLYLSCATNTLIIAAIAREYLAWIYGKQRYY